MKPIDAHLRVATAADAERLSRFAAETFHDTFAPDNRPEDMAVYLATSFSPERQRAEIETPGSTIVLAEVEPAVSGTAADTMNRELVGYVRITDEAPPPCVTGDAPLYLERLYVSRAWHGRGVAQQLMNRTLELVRARGGRTLWLGVWERNPRAIAFYRKYGFTPVGHTTFVLGTDRQTDVVMVVPITH